MIGVETRRKFITFACVGGVATAIHYLVLIIAVRGFDIGSTLGSSLGFTISAMFNYALNYRFTFNSTKAHTETLPKFIVIALSGLTLNGIVMEAGVVWLGAHYLLVQLVATGFVLFWNFLGNHLWSFRERSRDSIAS